MAKCVFKGLLFAFFLCRVIACKAPPPKPPVSPQKLGNMIADIQVAEVYSRGLTGKAKDSTIKRFEKNKDSLYVFYSSILSHYNVPFDKFNQAIEWYENHPPFMDSMLTLAINAINRQKARLGIMEEKKSTVDIKKEEDSLKNERIVPRQPLIRAKWDSV